MSKHAHGTPALKRIVLLLLIGAGSCLVATLFNPVFVLRDWGWQGARVGFDGDSLEPREDYRIGHEESDGHSDLIIWLDRRAIRPTEITITSVADQG